MSAKLDNLVKKHSFSRSFSGFLPWTDNNMLIKVNLFLSGLPFPSFTFPFLPFPSISVPFHSLPFTPLLPSLFALTSLPFSSFSLLTHLCCSLPTPFPSVHFPSPFPFLPFLFSSLSLPFPYRNSPTLFTLALGV